MNELWLPIDEFQGYEISSLGSVKSVARQDRAGKQTKTRRLSPARTGRGQYLSVSLRRNGKTFRRYIHQLVLTAFVGARPAGAQACHNNGDVADNSVLNLRWDSKRSNEEDKEAHGSRLRGERISWSVLKEDDVRAIRKLRADGEPLYKIADRFGITAAHACLVTKRRIWKHVSA